MWVGLGRAYCPRPTSRCFLPGCETYHFEADARSLQVHRSAADMAQDAIVLIDGFDYISPATGLLPKICYHPTRLYTPIPDVVPTKGREPFAPRPACGAASLLGQAECGCRGVVDAAHGANGALAIGLLKRSALSRRCLPSRLILPDA